MTYKRYFCKECEDYHVESSSLWKKHEKFKINRYYCPLCRRTHTASIGEVFLAHLGKRGKEIEFYGDLCVLKVKYMANNDVCLTTEDALIVEQFRGDLASLNFQWHDANFGMYNGDMMRLEKERMRINEEYEQLREKYSRFTKKINGNSKIRPMKFTSRLSSFTEGRMIPIQNHFKEL